MTKVRGNGDLEHNQVVFEKALRQVIDGRGRLRRSEMSSGAFLARSDASETISWRCGRSLCPAKQQRAAGAIAIQIWEALHERGLVGENRATSPTGGKPVNLAEGVPDAAA